MDWDAIGAIGEVVGAIATVASLIYLSLQVRANTLVTKRHALDDIKACVDSLFDPVCSITL